MTSQFTVAPREPDGSPPIRPATAADLDAIASCVRLSFEGYVPRLGRRPPPMDHSYADDIAQGRVHVVEVDGRFAGFVVFYAVDDRVLLQTVAVLPEHQGAGLGGLMVDFVEQSAREAGAAAIELYTHEKMRENIALYSRRGYRETARKPGDGVPRVHFRKDL